jgi:hypothetical protein
MASIFTGATCAPTRCMILCSIRRVKSANTFCRNERQSSRSTAEPAKSKTSPQRRRGQLCVADHRNSACTPPARHLAVTGQADAGRPRLQLVALREAIDGRAAWPSRRAVLRCRPRYRSLLEIPSFSRQRLDKIIKLCRQVDIRPRLWRWLLGARSTNLGKREAHCFKCG